MPQKVGVILSGCGVLDGAEIHESVLTLLALDRSGAEAVCMSPNKDQRDVVNHLTNQPMRGEKRNVLIEAARIARGKIRDIKEIHAKDIDAVILPGGYGAAKNLSDYAVKGADCEVDPEVSRLLREMTAAKKPIGAICISPVVLAKAMQVDGAVHPTLTIGCDRGVAGDLQKMGSSHQECPVQEFVVDKENKIVTTPAYMLGPGIKEVAQGIEKLVKAVLALIS
ncbi:MAG: isoprenoid biosynthesis glyoxalase ElbB [Deltaproteobacteria bacterium]|nr:isoprenoid biosynthesis glyoxalase ElbB [Deltaproteobacteria bacterium]